VIQDFIVAVGKVKPDSPLYKTDTFSRLVLFKLNLDEVLIAILKRFYEFSSLDGDNFHIRSMIAIVWSWVHGEDFHF
jgi:hypothetical protein